MHWGYWWRNLLKGDKGVCVGGDSVRLTRSEAQSSLSYGQRTCSTEAGYDFGPVQRITEPCPFDSVAAPPPTLPSAAIATGTAERVCSNRTCRVKTDAGKPCWNCGAS
jgi:hypothetical protein